MYFQMFPNPKQVIFKMEIEDSGSAVVTCISEMKNQTTKFLPVFF